MNESVMIYLIAFLAFLAVIVFVEGAYLLVRGLHEEGAAKVHQRLRRLSAGGGHGGEKLELMRTRELSELPLVNRLLGLFPRVHALDRMLEQTGSNLTVLKFLMWQLALAVVAVTVLLLLTHRYAPLFILLGIGVGFALPYLYVVRRRLRRHSKLTSQLPDAMDFIARSLRAGNPFSASLRSASQELADPIATEFGVTFDELNYGLDLEDALYNLGERTGSEEMRYFIAAVLIQKTTGGNLSEVLHRIAEVMRARARTYREIAIKAAEMRLSARVLVALPFVVAAAFSVLRPDYLPVLVKEPLGQVIILVQIALMIAGYLVMRHMINFRV